MFQEHRVVGGSSSHMIPVAHVHSGRPVIAQTKERQVNNEIGKHINGSNSLSQMPA